MEFSNAHPHVRNWGSRSNTVQGLKQPAIGPTRHMFSNILLWIILTVAQAHCRRSVFTTPHTKGPRTLLGSLVQLFNWMRNRPSKSKHGSPATPRSLAAAEKRHISQRSKVLDGPAEPKRIFDGSLGYTNPRPPCHAACRMQRAPDWPKL